MRYENEGEEKELAECKKRNKQLDCLKLHTRYEVREKKKKYMDTRKIVSHCIGFNFILDMRVQRRKKK